MDWPDANPVCADQWRSVALYGSGCRLTLQDRLGRSLTGSCLACPRGSRLNKPVKQLAQIQYEEFGSNLGP